MPKLKQVEYNFLFENRGLTKLEMPELKQVEYEFLYENEKLRELEVPKLKQVRGDFLNRNRILRGQGITELEEIKKALGKNRNLENKEQQKIDVNDIVELDENTRMRTSEINVGREMLNKINRKKEKEER